MTHDRLALIAARLADARQRYSLARRQGDAAGAAYARAEACPAARHPRRGRSMTGNVRALPCQGYAAEIGVAAYIKPDGSLGLFGTPGYAKGRIGSGAYHGVEVWTVGPNGGVTGAVVLSPADARAVADRLVAEAARLELAGAR